MDLNQITSYAKGRMKWLNRRYKKTFSLDEHETEKQRRLQEIYRDCKILLRKADIIRKKSKNEDTPHEMILEIEKDYRKLRFTTIPNFFSWEEITSNKK